MPVEPRLYTLREASDLTGLSVDALRQRIRRGKIAAVRGNDGQNRVHLDEDRVAALKTDRLDDREAPATDERLVELYERQLADLRDQVARERTRAERAEADAVRERADTRARIDRLEADLREQAARMGAEAGEERRRLLETIEKLSATLAEERIGMLRRLLRRLRRTETP